MINVFIRKIEKLSDDEIRIVTSSLSQSAKARLDRKRNEALRLASLCALSLIPKDMLFDLEYTESGIPYFKTMDVDISISHSNTYSTVAISDHAVGVDVEDISKEENPALFTRFFTENEQNELHNGTSPIEISTKKEALFKYLKNDSINFVSLDTAQCGVCFDTTKLEGAVLTVCTEKDEYISLIHNFKF
jgi:phosphopantetheinyl transferase